MCAALACGLAGCSGGDSTASTRFAPYVDVSQGTSRLPALARAGGTRDLTLAFVVADGKRCSAMWGGGVPIGDPGVASLARGTADVVSFGGRDPTELAERCPTAQTLAAQYQRALDRLDARTADFDLEAGSLTNPGAVARRSEAIALLQSRARAAGRPVSVMLTLPVEPSGLPGTALRATRSAVSAGVQLTRVNLLAMDFGDNLPARRPGTMGRYAIAAATSAARQLSQLLPGATGGRVWSRLGITVMLGRNDIASELFTARDASEVLGFAHSRGLGWLSFWSLARDRPCPHGTGGEQERCSGVAERPFAFTHQFGG